MIHENTTFLSWFIWFIWVFWAGPLIHLLKSIHRSPFINILLFWAFPCNESFKIHPSIYPSWFMTIWLFWAGPLMNLLKSICPSFHPSILKLSHPLFPTAEKTMTSEIKPRIPYDLFWVSLRLWHSVLPIYNCHRSINLLKHIQYPSTQSIYFL